MAASIRQQVVSAFLARMDGVISPTPADLKNRLLWPITGVIDGEDVVTRVEYGSNYVTMAMRVERIDEYDSQGALGRYGSTEKHIVGNQMEADIIYTAINADRTLAGLCQDIRYIGASVVYPDGDSHLIGAFVNFEIDFRFDVGDPYTDSYTE